MQIFIERDILSKGKHAVIHQSLRTKQFFIVLPEHEPFPDSTNPLRQAQEGAAARYSVDTQVVQLS